MNEQMTQEQAMEQVKIGFSPLGESEISALQSDAERALKLWETHPNGFYADAVNTLRLIRTLAQARSVALEEAAIEAIARAEHNKSCPAGCKCADGYHIAIAIRNLKDQPHAAPSAPGSAVREALEDASKFIDAAPEATWGYHEGHNERWPLKAELLHKINTALASLPSKEKQT